jgi:hypothetical protein
VGEGGTRRSPNLLKFTKITYLTLSKNTPILYGVIHRKRVQLFLLIWKCGYFFKTCKAHFSLREERMKSYKIQQVTHCGGKE